MRSRLTKKQRRRLSSHSLNTALGVDSPLNFTESTLTYDPTSLEVLAEPDPDGTYPGEPVVDDLNDIVSIDVSIEVSNAGGKGKGSGKSK